MRKCLSILFLLLVACSSSGHGRDPVFSNGPSGFAGREPSGFDILDWSKRVNWGVAGPEAPWLAPNDAYASAEPVQVVASDTILDFNDLATVSTRFSMHSVDRARAKPWLYNQTAIIVEGKRTVTIRNLHLYGFKVGILVRNCRSVTIENCTFDDMFRQQLRSTPDAEDARDWLWPHHNDDNEWASNYGAAIYVDRCQYCAIRDCQGRRGQNGVVFSRCENCSVIDCDFSYHSGWGCALWRSSSCQVQSNRFDYCVRGYSDGKYARGQDSAGILLFEQCNENLIAYNSATHSGDGLFIYAGHQTTQKTGMGGCNGNFVYFNDFSCSVANGIEATFSADNQFVSNRLDDCDYGIWAGYSYNTLISGNWIGRSLTAGIAIEHGHDNQILDNSLHDNKRGIWLWWDEDPGLTGGVYGEHQDTASHGYEIKWNRFARDVTAILLDTTSDVQIEANDFQPTKTLLECRSKVEGIALTVNNFRSGELKLPEGAGVKLGTNWKPTFSEPMFDTKPPEPTPGVRVQLQHYGIYERTRTMPAQENQDQDRPGRSSIVVGETGPVNVFQPVVLSFHGQPNVYWIAGPTDWKYEVIPGDFGGSVEIAPMSGSVPAKLSFRPKKGFTATYQMVVVRFLPPEVVPGVSPPGVCLSGTTTREDWTVRFWKWQAAEGHDGPADFKALTATEPVKVMQRDGLSYNLQAKAPEEGVPADFFATVAEAEFDLPEGVWRFVTNSDDGVRLYLNGELIIDNWTIHGPTEDSAQKTLKAGRYRVRIEHFEREGWAALSFRLEGW